MFTVDALLNGDWKTFSNALSHLILPALTLALYISGIISRITRSSLLEVLNQDYMRTARAKGLRERYVIGFHGMRNSLIPVVTVIGLSYGNLLVGSILIESIFAYPGIGFYMFRASTSQDFPAIMGVSLLLRLHLCRSELCRRYPLFLPRPANSSRLAAASWRCITCAATRWSRSA